MLSPSSSDFLGDRVLHIPLSDRWRIYHRLQELGIESSCHPDGSLLVRVDSLQTAILVRSTLIQFLASRQQLVDWLEHCWYYQPEA
ncbi:hypothetical protein H6G33_15650 [Calothrix sp. FACHB-1219]|uniref:Asr1405/Asl0597 family protein n=1 Tax=unclassified Calothrix TaxID=2619626 RepID=UPI0016881CCC|nr:MULTISPECIES: Asr1405/Asl0597 family protein [unclassified Calothrix]MBD2205339.1 hypothetical protein [Calothrix sp. FACHB-168]MBD2218470.1 hypothetical protein [Calothrix sp. FACHB-1219]